MSLLSLPQWKGPLRQKSSTPFFPGAWPGTPSTTRTAEHASGSDDIEALRHMGEGRENSGHCSGSPFPHLDHVMDFHRRISRSFVRSSRKPSSSLSLSPGTSALNVDIPQSPHMTGLSEYTDHSTSPSETLSTPDQFCPAEFSFSPSSKDYKHSFNTQKPIRPPRNPSRANSVTGPKTVLSSSTIPPDSPLLQFACKPQPPQAFSSPPSDTSYGTSPEQPSSVDASSDAAQSSPTHSQPSDISQPFPLTGFSSSFFPLLDKDTSCGFLSSSVFGSSRALGTDSPVLPPDNPSPGLNPASLYACRRREANALIPSSVDLDAFGIAASNLAFDSHSAIESLPTSFQSASALESADDTARGHACRQSSTSLSLSLDLSSSEHDSHHRARRFRQLCDSQYHLPKDTRSRRGNTPSPTPPFIQCSTGPTRTTSSRVVATHGRSAGTSSSKPSKFLSLEKVKKFGGRIKKLFKGKPPLAGNVESEIGVRTHTAVTAVEYTSERPIPNNESPSPSRLFNTPRSIAQSIMDRTPTKDSRNRRRQSMPATTTPIPIVSHPKSLRPVSFLAMDNSSGNDSRYLLSIPNIVGLSPSWPRPPAQDSTRRYSQIDSTHPASMRAPLPQVVVQPQTVSVGRSRTQTAPQPAREAQNAKTRRFSLTSALGEAIRTTVVPHPPLPQYALSRPIQHQRGHTHTRSMRTSVGDARNAARKFGRRNSVINHDALTSPDADPGEPPLPARSTLPVVDVRPDVGGHSRVEVVARYTQDTATVSENQPPHSRTRSHTQSTVQEAGRSRQRSRTHDDNQAQLPTKRRSRGFSLSSAISKRAMKARSMIAGRGGEASSTVPISRVRSDLDALTSGMTTSVSGVSFDMLTPGIVASAGNNHSLHGDNGTVSGCAEYEPDLVLDRMSFATTDIQSTPVSSTDLSISPQSDNVAVHAVGITMSPNTSSSTFAEDEGTSTGPVAGDSEEVQEEREFMRALGLEFDEIVRRARD